MACQRSTITSLSVKPIELNKTIIPIGVGDILPDVPLILQHERTESFREYFSKNSAVLFAVPGAFTPTCTERHLPGFQLRSKDIKQYVSSIVCLAINDSFVLNAWGEASNKTEEDKNSIIFLSDPQAALTTTLGLSQDLTSKGLGIRSQRFAMIINQGVVQWIGFNEESYAENVLEILPSFDLSNFLVDPCVDASIKIAKLSRAPYSNRANCGVAIQTNKGIFAGCTVENCAYPNSICAIKAALVNAVSEGITRIDGMTVIGDNATDYPYICGQCREFMSQFGNFSVVLCNKGTCVSYGMCIKHVCIGGTKRMFRNVIELLPGKSLLPHSLKDRIVELDVAILKQYLPASSVQASKDMLNLYSKAIEACGNAYCPISHFPVGAALLTNKGLFTGSNIEHNIIGLGLCAERTALCKAVAGGATIMNVMAIVCFKMEDFGSPCGGCRQNLVEFENFPIHLLKMDHKNKTYHVTITSTFDILPNAFTPAALK